MFKFCEDPVLSCGLILVDTQSLPADPSKTKILMIRRKDSMSFAEFMRGKYNPANIEYISLLFENMTLQEQTTIVCEPFDSIWRQLWGDDHTSPEYLASKEKFNQVDREAIMRSHMSVYKEPEWGFPKGRRVRCESDVECAIREFNEETNIPRDAYTIVNNIVLEETFVGLNGITYRHLYFVVLLTSPEMVNLNQKMTYMQRREISGIGWKSFDECRAYIRPHHVQREIMVERLENIVKTYESTL